ncbi:MAG: AMP-binding protein [Deltaproteobacteria bacterium]|nr:AMP-binding protein [Deltaproteobacteria bacterium]
MNAPNTLQNLLETLPEGGRKPFLVTFRKAGRQTHTYADLSRSARRFAQGLLREGVRRGDVVGLFAPLGFAWTVVCLGSLQAGAVVMPLDVQLERETLAGILKDSHPRWVFTDGERLERLRQAAPEGLSPVLLDGRKAENQWGRFLAGDAPSLPEIRPDQGAALFYTSGTTGPPKGVPLSHANLVFQIDTVRETGLITPGDRVLLPLPPHHVYPFVIGVLAPLSLGITIVLPHALTGPQLVRALREGGITLLLGVPRLYDALLEGLASRFGSGGAVRRVFDQGLQAEAALRSRTGLSPGKHLLGPLRRRFAPDLRIMASGGAPLPPELASRLESLGWQVAIGYGLTETSPLLTLKLPGDQRHDTVGRPVRGVELRIDPGVMPGSNGREDQAAQGEIQARGPNVFSGYHNLPGKTAEAFTRDGWFRTGDLGFLDREGYLHLTGRVSTLIVTPGGENIQPDRIEARLASHALIREAGVLQLGDGALAAVIVPEIREMHARGIQDADRAARVAAAERSRNLPSYQRVNRVAVTRRPIPRTRLGKIRRHLLEELFQRAEAEETSPDRGGTGPVALFDMSAEDQGLLENPAARKVWDRLADRYRDHRLTPDTSPDLDLGIDSMEWLNLTLEIRRYAGVELEEEEIGGIATVRDLLETVSEKAASGGAGSMASPLEEPEKMLTRAQMRWLEPTGAVEHALARGLFELDRWIVRGLFGLRARGLENLPAGGGFLITPNHVSYLDPFAVAAALGFSRLRRLYWAGFAGAAFRNPFFRYFSRLSQTVPVDPDKGMISSMAFGAAVIKRGWGLVWFPEGRRSPDGRLQPFKTGVGLLLEHHPVPVVPAVIRGTERILPPGKAIPRPGEITVMFGPPLDPAELARRGTGREARVRIASALQEEVARLESSVQP